MTIRRLETGTMGGRVRALRLDAGLSTRALAKEIGVSAMAISKWERGESYPGSQQLLAMSRLFNVSADFLLSGLHLQALELCIGAAWAAGAISRGKAVELVAAFGLSGPAVSKAHDETFAELRQADYDPRALAAAL